MTSGSDARTYDLVVVSNRLPVDSQVGPDGSVEWVRSPGGLISALEPVMRGTDAAWVGWPGSPDLDLEPFDADGMRLVPVTLDEGDVERHYEGFSNDSIWPLYHDVIAVPTYHRDWWESYVAVNRRFAAAAAAVAAEGATVWGARLPDATRPAAPPGAPARPRDRVLPAYSVPPYGLLRTAAVALADVDGLLGADVVGFQRVGDAANFATAVRRLTDSVVRAQHRGNEIEVGDSGQGRRVVVARAFPISIDAAGFEALARTPEVQARAREIGRASARTARCSSAWIGSTTRRASSTASRPTRSCSRTAP